MQIEDLLISLSNITTDLLPDVLIVNGLNEYFSADKNSYLTEFQLSKIFSLLTETTEYLGRRKNATALLFVSPLLYMPGCF